jgi:hypothetical protein
VSVVARVTVTRVRVARTSPLACWTWTVSAAVAFALSRRFVLGAAAVAAASAGLGYPATRAAEAISKANVPSIRTARRRELGACGTMEYPVRLY